MRVNATAVAATLCPVSLLLITLMGSVSGFLHVPLTNTHMCRSMQHWQSQHQLSTLASPFLRTRSASARTRTIGKTCATRQRSTMLSMHMGHSHSHHHHHPEPLSSTSQTAVSQQPPWMKRGRISALLLFSALAILGPPLVRQRALANKDVAAFMLTASSLFILEPLRNQVKHILLRIRQLGDGISRHSGPISPKYFLKNESAADRVTLMG